VGEAPETTVRFDIKRAVAYDKIDGSLIKVYNFGGTWYCATRGTAFAESEVNGFPLTFEDLVHDAVSVANDVEFNELCNQHLDRSVTYLFEVTSMENRVVTRYSGTKLWFLGARKTATGEDLTQLEREWLADSEFPCEMPKEYEFNTVENCVSSAAALTDLQEGYVLHDKLTNIRQKAKSPAYVAV